MLVWSVTRNIFPFHLSASSILELHYLQTYSTHPLPHTQVVLRKKCFALSDVFWFGEQLCGKRKNVTNCYQSSCPNHIKWVKEAFSVNIPTAASFKLQSPHSPAGFWLLLHCVHVETNGLQFSSWQSLRNHFSVSLSQRGMKMWWVLPFK